MGKGVPHQNHALELWIGLMQLAPSQQAREPSPGLPDAPAAAWEREDFDQVHFALAKGIRCDRGKAHRSSP